MALAVASVEVLAVVLAVVLEEVAVEASTPAAVEEPASAVGSVWGVLASAQAVVEAWGWALVVAGAAAPVSSLYPPPPLLGRASRAKSLLQVTASQVQPADPMACLFQVVAQPKFFLFLECSLDKHIAELHSLAPGKCPIPSL